jgi:molybdate transport system substrate-binding protein
VAPTLRLLSGGAAQGLVASLTPRFTFASGCGIDGTFGAVGAMREKFLAGAPADLLILTAPLIAELAREARVIAGSAIDLGAVPTCIAVRAGDATPAVGDAAALRAALRAADAIYFPDPKLATAGIHFAKVIEALGLANEVAARLRPFPNGATAMQALAQATDARPIGCTQATEILNTPGCALVGPLPGEFALAAVYTVAVAAAAALPDHARQFAGMLTGDDSEALRRRLGFVT